MTTRSKVVALGGALLIAASSVSGVFASSHREAPLISGDPSADNTDLYAFVSPDDPTKLTIVANYIPLQQPGGGPNFHPFDDSVRYRIHIDNTATRRTTSPTRSGSRPTRNRARTASRRSSTTTARSRRSTTRRGLRRRPIGRAHEGGRRDDARHEPAHGAGQHRPALDARLRLPGRHRRSRAVNGGQAYAGPRDDAFFVDLGSIFDLGGLRPFNTLHVIPLDTETGVDGVAGYNTASIVLQVPITEVRQSAGQPVVGVWASADRKANKEISTNGKVKWSGPWVQVSRLGDPLINEVIIPRHLKDYWNGQPPSKDSQFLKYYEAPELAGLVNFLYPALADVDTTGRTDLSLILLKGVPGVNRSDRTRWPPTCCGSTPRSCPASTGRAPAARPTPASRTDSRSSPPTCAASRTGGDWSTT